MLICFTAPIAREAAITCPRPIEASGYTITLERDEETDARFLHAIEYFAELSVTYFRSSIGSSSIFALLLLQSAMLLKSTLFASARMTSRQCALSFISNMTCMFRPNSGFVNRMVSAASLPLR